MSDQAVSISPKQGPSSGGQAVSVSGPSAGGAQASYTPGPGSPEVILGRVLDAFGLEPEAGA